MTELERYRRAKVLIDGMDEIDILTALAMLETSCVKCDIRHQCEFAYAPYNIGVEPKIDCLAAK